MLIPCMPALFANNPIDATPPITHVTVYLEGAQITRQGKIDLQSGKNTITISGLSPQIDPQSIQVKLSDGVLTESVLHDIDYLNNLKVNTIITQLRAEKIRLLDSIKLLKSYAGVYQDEKKMILSNQSLKGDAGLDVSMLEKAAEFYRKRLKDVENNLFENQRQSRRLKKRLYAVSKTLLDSEMQSEVPTSVITIVVSTKTAMTAPLEIKYLVTDAGWQPSYDLRVQEADQPLTVDYKAAVHQGSGEDWENVRLTLSTGNPFVSHDRPHLETYYLSYNNYYARRGQASSPQNNRRGNVVTGIVVDAMGEPLIGATVLEKGTANGVVTDMEGHYELKLLSPQSKIIVSYVGYNNTEATVGNQRTVNIVLEEGAQLDEVVVTARGSRTRANRYMIDGIKIDKRESKKIIPVAIEKSQTTTQFEIEIPYTIPSDNENYSVAMVQYKIPADYLYTAVPKLSDKAYLTAQITDWHSYRFLNGTVHLFLKGVFQGDTYLDLETVEDTLSLSVGIDEDIVIKREIQQDYTRTRIIGSNKKVSKAWQTTIKNNKPIPVRILVEDQYPISKNSGIKVAIQETSGAKINESTGQLKWDLHIPANTSKKLNVRYEVKYPKGRVVIVE